MMNLVETLNALYDATEDITVYAANVRSHVDGECLTCIGIRSHFEGYDNHDPVVDGQSFMICGDVFTSKGKKVTDIRYLRDIWTNLSDFFVTLRAISSMYPKVTIDLGEYEIYQSSDLDENQKITLDLIRIR